MEQKYHRSRSFLGVTRRKSIWFIPQPLPFFFCWISHPLLKLRVYDDGTKISSQPFISNCHAYGVDLIHPSHCLSCVFTTIELKYHPSRSFSNCYASGIELTHPSRSFLIVTPSDSTWFIPAILKLQLLTWTLEMNGLDDSILDDAEMNGLDENELIGAVQQHFFTHFQLSSKPFYSYFFYSFSFSTVSI